MDSTSIVQFFDDALSFLKKHQWIFKYPNTEILVQDVFESIPSDWLPLLKDMKLTDLNGLVLGESKVHFPSTLNTFLSKVREMSLAKQWNKPKVEYNIGRNSGLSVKKQHEIFCLAPIVSEICDLTESKNVLDVGAGLGYLSFLLADNHDCSVLAVEGCAEKINLGFKTQVKRHDCCRGKVSFLHHFIVKDSLGKLENALREQFSDSNKICICGLHACADLSIIILELFLKMKQVKSLVIMPCCYHRLSLEKVEGGREYFHSFPVSLLLKSKIQEQDAMSFLGRPFLRLACQQTLKSFLSMDEQEHREHAEHFLLRAVLQKAADEVGCSVSRLKRRTGKNTSKSNILETYLENLEQTHKLIPNNTSIQAISIGDPEFKSIMSKVWEEHKDQLFLVEALTALQTSLQSICENILLQDRVQYLIENGVNCDIRKVTDDNISPRCYALVAIKK